MSLFEDKAVCERVNFYSHHIDPQIPNVSGVLSLANGHTTVSTVADQVYTLTTVSSSDPSSNDHLQLVGQSGGPSPAVLAMDVAPDGTVNFPVAIQVNGSPVGGGSAQSKQYVVSIATPPPPMYNTTSEYTFDISGCTGNYYAFTFDNISGTMNTAGSGVAYDIYLCDTLNGAYNPANGCIKLNTGVLTQGVTYNSGPRTLIYKNATAPTNLYLNYVQTNPGQQTGQLLNLTFNCEMISQSVTVL